MHTSYVAKSLHMEEVLNVGQKDFSLSGRGKYECGACVCEEGYTGLDCSCNAEDQGTYLTNCTDPVNGLICNDRGVCQCGNCICK